MADINGNKTGGRQKGTPNKYKSEIRDIIDNVVDFNIVVGKLFELTKGITVQETDTEGNTSIYTKAPDSKAANILLEYRFGKPQAFVDVTTNGESLNLPLENVSDATLTESIDRLEQETTVEDIEEGESAT